MLSKFVQLQDERRRFRLGEGEWTTQDFEERVLGPIFRYASTVKIVDRLIAGSYKRGDVLEQRFTDSLRWITEVLARQTRFQHWTLEVYTCGPHNAPGNPLLRAQVKAAASAFEAELCGTYGNRVRLHVMRDDKSSQREMPHDRYILTDSCGVMVGRGLDLLWTDQQMRARGLDPARDPRRLRNTEIALSPSPADVEWEVRRLAPL
jgi:hypothetical protein